MNSARRPPQKKSYRPPRLKVYGDLRRLTMAKRGIAADGAGVPKTKVAAKA